MVVIGEEKEGWLFMGRERKEADQSYQEVSLKAGLFGGGRLSGYEAWGLFAEGLAVQKMI